MRNLLIGSQLVGGVSLLRTQAFFRRCVTMPIVNPMPSMRTCLLSMRTVSPTNFQFTTPSHPLSRKFNSSTERGDGWSANGLRSSNLLASRAIESLPRHSLNSYGNNRFSSIPTLSTKLRNESTPLSNRTPRCLATIKSSSQLLGLDQ